MLWLICEAPGNGHALRIGLLLKMYVQCQAESEKPSTMNKPMEYAPKSLMKLGPLGVESNPLDLELERGQQAFKRFVESFRRRWFYYSLVVVLAGGLGFFAAIEWGSYSYKVSSLVRSKTIHFPPGEAFYTPPRIEDFVKYLSDPEVTTSLIKDFGLPSTSNKFFEHQLEFSTGVVTVEVEAAQADKATELVNQLVVRAIDKSTEERTTMLASSLDYYRRLVGEAEASASLQRHAKVERIEVLRRNMAVDGNPQLQFAELTEVVSLKRSELSALKSELRDSERLVTILEDDEQALVTKIHAELEAECLQQIELMAEQFTATSTKASDLKRKAEAVKSMAENGLKDRKELTDWMRSVAVVARLQLLVPPEHQVALDRIVNNLYDLKNRLLLLPEKIEETTRALAQATQQRALLTISDELDFENIPEIQELSILIARAEENAEQIAAAIAWIENLQKLDTPAFAQTMPGSVDSAAAKGNHHKFFVLAFGLTGLLLAFPMILLDLVYIPMSAAQKLGNELGLATIPTHEIMARTSTTAALRVGDPELRLLALRIQQMAREARGSVVLFSSLADSVSTKELTTTLAQCLAARREKVLIIDLESIGENRGQPATHKRLTASSASTRKLAVASPPVPQVADLAPLARSGEMVGGDGHSLSNGKMGLALALSGRATVPEDVMIEHGDDGVDRVLLGSGELPLEAFATPLMGQLLDNYRNAYSMVLLSGPAAKHLADVQMLASRCDGTLFVVPEKGGVAQTARRTVVELMENRRVILGLAEVPG